MSKITEQIYLGNYKDASNKEWLEKNNITHVINATKDLPNYFPDTYKYLQLHLDDTMHQSLYEVLEPSYQFIRGAIGNGGTVFIHCLAGVSRSVSILIYFLMKTNGSTYLKTLDFIRRKRLIANPNPGFARQLVSVSPEAARVFL